MKYAKRFINTQKSADLNEFKKLMNSANQKLLIYEVDIVTLYQ